MSLRRHLCQLAVVASLATLSGAHAQGQRPSAPDPAINDAISDAVREGSHRFQPTPSQPLSRDEQCDRLAEQIGQTPRRSYRPSNAPVENSQGNDVATVERDRTRRQLQKVYQEKCTR
ncbi:hypothetical protein [Cupriavidus pinatubonensis]|uniref:hypothetical protein n=1 Tax=Cupriavidus pinatubonensis TaxID=248026 RepID=UPI001126603E|nr:hypothetical protein [Cupriavidus pinatubonensis]TPQ36305.1 hypothetical protein C2U69_18815 [Cupriavidus pinatubonensis]